MSVAVAHDPRLAAFPAGPWDAFAAQASPARTAARQAPLRNLGYWGDGAVTAREAQITLVRRLADRLGDLRDQRVLDAAGGLGGAAGVLAREYGAYVEAINSDAEELEVARNHAAASGVDDRIGFHLAAATRLPFPDACFDAVVAVEAATGITDKPRFAAEVHRVLAPGGLMVLSDITVTHEASIMGRLADGLELVTAKAWRGLLEGSGLEVLELVGVGASVYPGHRRWLMLTAGERRRSILESENAPRGAGRLPGVRHGQAWLREFMAHRATPVTASALGLRDYVLILARRPEAL